MASQMPVRWIFNNRLFWINWMIKNCTELAVRIIFQLDIIVLAWPRGFKMDMMPSGVMSSWWRHNALKPAQYPSTVATSVQAPLESSKPSVATKMAATRKSVRTDNQRIWEKSKSLLCHQKRLWYMPSNAVLTLWVWNNILHYLRCFLSTICFHWLDFWHQLYRSKLNNWTFEERQPWRLRIFSVAPLDLVSCISVYHLGTRHIVRWRILHGLQTTMLAIAPWKRPRKLWILKVYWSWW